VFIAALFTIAERWKQPRCPIPDENVIFIYIEIYSAIKNSFLEEKVCKCRLNESVRRY
jgi:hypothetical protein